MLPSSRGRVNNACIMVEIAAFPGISRDGPMAWNNLSGALFEECSGRSLLSSFIGAGKHPFEGSTFDLINNMGGGMQHAVSACHCAHRGECFCTNPCLQARRSDGNRPLWRGHPAETLVIHAVFCAHVDGGGTVSGADGDCYGQRAQGARPKL